MMVFDDCRDPRTVLAETLIQTLTWRDLRI